ncbi:MAG: SUMF1/EgtB/PvdO family nonheme iron enzyme [Magnetococcales bacterium]|nr:SUMF1/EgtB/PvdO family nonheme iron enzyme [Magnetococcales bacterium]
MNRLPGMMRHIPTNTLWTFLAQFMLILLLAVETVSSVQASPPPSRAALVIGNSAYADAPLINPHNDAHDLAITLRTLGFQVEHASNLDRKQMRRAIRSFGEHLRQEGGVGLFFYAGHGMQVNGKNYLIPINADILHEDEIADEAVEADLVLRKMESANNGMNLMILDACRNNPFARSFRSSSSGLAQMDAPVGTLIAYSTAPGSVAADGNGRNSPYTHHLLDKISTPGLTVEQLFKQVRAALIKETDRQQISWESSSLVGDFSFAARGEDPAEPSLAHENRPPAAPPEQQTKSARSPPSPETASPSRKASLSDCWHQTTPGHLCTEPVTQIPFVRIPEGCFQMGSPRSEKGRSGDEGPQHEVCLKGFWMAIHALTNRQYRLFRGDHDSGRARNHTLSGDAQPVVNISWQDANAYAAWLTSKGNGTFGLPTEAQWEYAARAGTTTSRYWGESSSISCRYANLADGTAKREWSLLRKHACEDGYAATSPVGQFLANPFGLFDMQGNVWEWTSDRYGRHTYKNSPNTDPTGPERGLSRVLRGGSWADGPRLGRIAYRHHLLPGVRNKRSGMRLVRK